MTARLLAILLLAQWVGSPALAENQMGYRLLTKQQSGGLPRNGGTLGMDVERAQSITDDGMTFDIIRVKQVRRGSSGEHAGFHVGDQIIAMDGWVFPSLAGFAAYVNSVPAGRQISVDYMPANQGPGQAQRVAVAMGPTSKGTQADVKPQQNDAKEQGGMSTGTKIAIGVGAAALFGCYELGCFSRRTDRNAAPSK